jgi:hypothetical protein
MPEIIDAVTETKTSIAPTQEKRIAGKCPWCEDRRPKIEKDLAALLPLYNADQERVQQVREQLEAQGKSTLGLVNQYGLELKELRAEKDRNKDYKLLNIGHKVQCGGCGKMWDHAAIGKPYSLELERGIAYAEEKEKKKVA